MGACTFFQEAKGATAKDAFANAVFDAQYEHGHGGYSGTLAEKRDFVMIELPPGQTPHTYADELINNSDSRIDDKWGPAGCIKIDGDNYLFFGWASS